MVSCGTATVFFGQRPLPSGSAKTMCERWFALSVFFPSQQFWNSAIRSTLLPAGQSGYFVVVTRFSKPVQLHLALALAPPLVAALASPVMMRRNRGIAVTLARGLPR